MRTSEKDQGFLARSHMRNDQRSFDLLSSPSLPSEKAAEILSSADVMAEFFRTRLSRLFPEDRVLTKCVPEVLRKRVSTRQIVSYRLVFSGARKPLTLVLKRYADKTEAGRVYSVMKMLWNNEFNRRSKLKIPEPFSVLEDLGLLVFEKAPGRQLCEYLSQSGPAAMARMKAVARWLAKLHYLNIDLERISPHPDEQDGLRAFARHAGSKEPRLLARLEELTYLILMKLSPFTKVPMVPVHGDFQCGNIFVAKDKVTVIDFDKFCRSDPARDLGYMIAQARTAAFRDRLPYEGVYAGLRAFWHEYLNAAPEVQKETLSTRANLFAARKCLQNIDYILSYAPREDTVEIVDILLGEARRFTRAEGVEEALEVPTGAASRSSG